MIAVVLQLRAKGYYPDDPIYLAGRVYTLRYGFYCDHCGKTPCHHERNTYTLCGAHLYKRFVSGAPP